MDSDTDKTATGTDRSLSIHPDTPAILLEMTTTDSDVVALLGTRRSERNLDPCRWVYAIECRYQFPKYEVGLYDAATGQYYPQQFACGLRENLERAWTEEMLF